MHHCVERYHDKSDSLILSARIADRRVETVEVSLSRLQVVQSRGRAIGIRSIMTASSAS